MRTPLNSGRTKNHQSPVGTREETVLFLNTNVPTKNRNPSPHTWQYLARMECKLKPAPHESKATSRPMPTLHSHFGSPLFIIPSSPLSLKSCVNSSLLRNDTCSLSVAISPQPRSKRFLPRETKSQGVGSEE